MSRGVATAEQQVRALTFIVEQLSAYYDLSYCDSDRDTAFVEGRRFVGGQIVQHTKLKLENIEDDTRRNRSGREQPD